MRAPQTAEFADRVLAWFDRHGRKHLPWQEERTPYRVWISEIMLQQTQVATVIPYYHRFMQRFPTVQALAEAPIDEVLHLWTGLGYYARARNLHRAARTLVEQFVGEFPPSHEAVESLPGIGRSTASAILALSRGERHAILDGNVKRVLARCFGVEGFPGEAAVNAQLWTLAEACTPSQRVADYTQAMMDIGATVCVRTQPACAACPLSASCVARLTGRQRELPTPRPKKVRPQRTAIVLLVLDRAGAFLLQQRPPEGLWGGLWTLPQFDDVDAADQWLATRGLMATAEVLEPYRHAFTHFDLTLHPRVIRQAVLNIVADEPHLRWYDPARPAAIGLTKPTLDLMKAIDAPGTLQLDWSES